MEHEILTMDTGWRGGFELEHKSRDGEVVWQGHAQNALCQEGERSILSYFFLGNMTHRPSSFHIGLGASDHTITATSGGGDAKMSEVHNPITSDPGAADNGYWPITIAASMVDEMVQLPEQQLILAGWPSITIDSMQTHDEVISSRQCEFTAITAWPTAVDRVHLIANDLEYILIGGGAIPLAVPKLIAFAQLDNPRTMLAGDTLRVTYKVKLQ